MNKTERLKLRKEKPETWVATEPGDSITGKVIDLDVAYSDVQAANRGGNGNYPLLTIEVAEAAGYTPGQELKVHGFGTVLHNEIVKRKPIPGETVTITYTGMGEVRVKGQNAPEIYRVSVPGRDPREQADNVYSQLTPKGQGGTPANGEQHSPPVAEDPIPF